MKKTKLSFVVTFIVLWAIPFLSGIILYDRLPEMMPIHYNFQGVPDNYASKPLTLFAIPGFMLAAHLLVLFFIENNPQKEEVPQKLALLICWLVPVLAIVIQISSIVFSLGGAFDVTMILSVLLGCLLVVIGNYLPKCRQNYVMGIRLPWTLNNTENWNRTHRLAGWLWIIGGGIMILNGFLRSLAVILLMAAVLVIIPTIYSYRLYKKGY